MAFFALIILTSVNIFAAPPIITGFSLDGEPATQKSKNVYEHEGTEFKISFVSEEDDQFTFKFTYRYDDEEITEELVAEITTLKARPPILSKSYNKERTVSSFREASNQRGYKGSKKVQWNADQEISFENGDNWTPTLKLSAQYALHLFEPEVTVDQEKHRTIVSLPYGVEGEEPYGLMKVHSFAHEPTEKDGGDKFYYCDSQGHLKTAGIGVYSTPKHEKQWVLENEIESDDYEDIVTGERIGYIVDAKTLRKKHLTLERLELQKSPYIYADGNGKYFIASVTKCKFKEYKGDGTSFTKTLIEATKAPLKLPPNAVTHGEFAKGFYQRTSKENGEEEWTEFPLGHNVVNYVCDTRAFIILSTEKMTKEEAIELEQAVNKFKRDGQRMWLDSGTDAAGVADHILLFQLYFDARLTAKEFNLEGYKLQNKALIHLASQDLDRATARTVEISPRNFLPAWNAFIALKKCTPTNLDLRGCDLSNCLVELKDHVEKNESLEVLKMGKAYAPQRTYYDLIAKLAAHKKLKEFHVDEFIQDNNIDEDDAETLYPKLRGLTVLVVTNILLDSDGRFFWTTNSGHPLKGSAKTLKKLDVSGCFNIYSCFAEGLKECTALEELNIQQCEVPGKYQRGSGEDSYYIAHHLDNYELIKIIEVLANLPHFKKLSLTMPYYAFHLQDLNGEFKDSLWNAKSLAEALFYVGVYPAVALYVGTVSELKGDQQRIEYLALYHLAKIPALEELKFKLWGWRKYPDQMIAEIEKHRRSNRLPKIDTITYVP